MEKDEFPPLKFRPTSTLNFSTPPPITALASCQAYLQLSAMVKESWAATWTRRSPGSTRLRLLPHRVTRDRATHSPELEPVIPDKAIGIDFLRKLVLSWFR